MYSVANFSSTASALKPGYSAANLLSSVVQKINKTVEPDIACLCSLFGKECPRQGTPQLLLSFILR